MTWALTNSFGKSSDPISLDVGSTGLPLVVGRAVSQCGFDGALDNGDEALVPDTGDLAEAPVAERRPILRSLLAYLRRPRVVEPHDTSPKWWAALKLLGIDFALLIPFGAIAYAASKGIDSETFIADEGLTTTEIVIFGVIMAPLIEESAFRLWINALRPAFLITGGILMLLFAFDGTVDLSLLMLVPVAALLTIGIASNRQKGHQQIEPVWNTHFGWVFYGSAVAFGMVHLFNYDLGVTDAADLTLAPLLIAPQMAGGLVLAYARVRLGFWYAVTNHALYNGILTIPEIVAG